MRAHTLDMTVGSPARLLLRFSLPLFVGNLFQQVYNLADTAIAGHLLGDAALSQIGATAAPLICSTMELVCKAIFGFKPVPMLGYPAVCACEPVAWVICMVFILAPAYAFKRDFNDIREAHS